MKRVLMSAAFILATVFAANAQKSTVLVGGNIDFTSTKTPGTPDDTKNSSFEFNPTVGYQFNDNWTAGVVANFGMAKSTTGSAESKYNSFGVGPFIRYAHPISNLFAVYGQLQGEFGSYKNKSGSTTISKGSLTDINLFPALFINFKNSFGLNFNIGGISYGSTKPTGGSSTNTFNFNFGKEVGIGISKNFGGKK